MKKIHSRTKFCIILCLIFIGGIFLFLTKYYKNKENWSLDKYYAAIGYKPITNSDIINNADANRTRTKHAYYTDDTNKEKLYVRGSIVDRSGTLLAKVDENGITYNENDNIRTTMAKIVGDRRRNISTSALVVFSEEMSRFVTKNGEYAEESQGNTVKLTMDSDIEEVAIKALGKYKGMVGVYNYKTGAIVCNVSTPTFDPDNIPEDILTNDDYKGCYMNYLYSSVFQPGSTMKTVTLEAAIDTIPDLFKRTYYCDGSMKFGSQTLHCTGRHGMSQSIQTAYANSCNCAFAQISQLLTRDTMYKNVNNGLITTSYVIDGKIHTAKGSFDIMEDDDYQFAWTCIGLHHNQVNPCTMMMYMGCIANGGYAAVPTNLLEVTDSEGNVIKTLKTEYTAQIINESTAKAMREIMINNTVNHAAHYAAHRFNMLFGAKTGTTSNPDKTSNGLFSGFIADPRYPYAFYCFVGRSTAGVNVPGSIVAKVLNAIYADPQYADPDAAAPTPWVYYAPGHTPAPTRVPTKPPVENNNQENNNTSADPTPTKVPDNAGNSNENNETNTPAENDNPGGDDTPDTNEPQSGDDNPGGNGDQETNENTGENTETPPDNGGEGTTENGNAG